MLTDEKIEDLVDECFDSLKKIVKINKEMNECCLSFLKDPALNDILLRYVNDSDDNIDDWPNDPDARILTESKGGKQLIEIAKNLLNEQEYVQRILCQLVGDKIQRFVDKMAIFIVLDILRQKATVDEKGVHVLPNIANIFTKIIKMRINELMQEILATFSGINVSVVGSESVH